MSGTLWQIVGGADKGGIVVRDGKALDSPVSDAGRLSCGALVRELERHGERLRFELVKGAGPAAGWISLKVAGKDLAVPAPPGKEPTSEGGQTEKKQEFDPYALIGVTPSATDANIKSAFRKASLRVHPDRCPDDPNAAARFRELTEAKNFLLDPFRRRMYNLKHKLIVPTRDVEWWSDWDEIFDEIDAGEEEEGDATAGATSQVPQAPSEPRVDILIFGATGLTGTLACMAMIRRHSQRTWMIAGRDARKLGLLATKFGGGPMFRGTLRVETPAEIEQAASAARVVVDLSGPSPLVGKVVAEACVRAGAHCVDNTVDVVFSKQVQAELHEAAREAGVCLMCHVGYNSLLADFGVWRIVKHMREAHGVPTRRVDAYKHVRGFVRSGTSNFSAVQNEDGAWKKHGAFILGGVRPVGIRPEDEDKAGERYSQGYHGGMIAELDVNYADRMVVRGSCGLLDKTEPYGDNFLFKNWTLFKDAHAADMATFYNVYLKRSYQKLVDQKKLPPRGAGPKERIRQETFVTLILVAEADDVQEAADEPSGRKAYCVVNCGPGGVGDRYEGTAVMAVEAAHTLLDAGDTGATLRPGFGTPVSHLAHLGFLERLVARGFSFKLVDEAPTRELFRNVMESTMPIEV